MLQRFLAGVLCITFGLVAAAQAQYVERNLPPSAPARAPALRGVPELLTSTDATPLGANLCAVVILGAKDKPAPRRGCAAGVDISRADPAFAPLMRDQIAPLLGQPLSQKLIGDVQKAVARVYRGAGRPFVSITAPPQEVTRGVLQIRVIEFRLGRVNIQGSPSAAEHVRAGFRLAPGAVIDARVLETDIDWLNRNPLIRVEAVFAPGKELGTTDVTLQVTESRPIQGFAGYANSGTVLTDRDRFFAGAVASLGFGAFASYQVSGSKNFWGDGGHWFNEADAGYASHAGRLVVPLWVRSSLEVLADTVRTNERPIAAPLLRTDTREMLVLSRTALSNASPVLIGDLLAGVEFKHQQRDLFLAGVDTFQASADVFQYALGWAGQWADEYGVNNLDMRVKNNPGGVLGGNTAANWVTYTGGRVTDNRATFATVAYGRVTPLWVGTSLSTEFYGLVSGKALPDTERIAPGGAQVVRGYVIDDGAFDRAYVLRNSLYAQSIAMPTTNTIFTGALAPFVFSDVGTAHDVFSGRDATLASVGAGLDQAFGGFYRANLTAAYALRDGPFTDAGTWRLHARVVLTY